MLFDVIVMVPTAAQVEAETAFAAGAIAVGTQNALQAEKINPAFCKRVPEQDFGGTHSQIFAYTLAVVPAQGESGGEQQGQLAGQEEVGGGEVPDDVA